MMKKALSLLVLALLPTACAASGAEQAHDLIQLFAKVYANGELIAEPSVAMKPGTDASFTIGPDPAFTNAQSKEEGEYVLQITLHSTHMRDDGAEMLVDVDFGQRKAEHVEAKYLLLPWDEVHETTFIGEGGVLDLRVELTPTRGSMADFERRYREGR